MSTEANPIHEGATNGEAQPPMQNPYAPPSAPLEVLGGEVIEAQFPEASSGKRFLNLLIDRLAITGVAMVLGAAVGVLEQLGVVSGWLSWLTSLNTLEDMLVTAVLGVVYYTTFETLCGLTIGKLITGSKVITTQGTRPALGTIFRRSLTRIIPFEPFSFLGDSRWHDRWSGTCVVDVRAGRAALSRIGRPIN